MTTLAGASACLVNDAIESLCERIEASDIPRPPGMSIRQAACLLVAGHLMRHARDHGGQEGVSWLLGVLQDVAADPDFVGVPDLQGTRH